MKPFLAVLLAAALPTAASAEPAPSRAKWVYCSTNLATGKNVDDLEALFRRAAQSGYNCVLLNDSKFSRLGEMDARYFQNVDRLKRAAAETKLQIVPAVFPVGYSNTLLSLDPNLAEALPVREALYVVHDGAAKLSADPAVALKGADFRDFSGWPMHDDTVAVAGNTACVTDPVNRNARIMQTVQVRPFRQYHVSVEVKTKEVTGAVPEILVLGKDGFRLTHSNLGVARTQDWKTCHSVFNSLESDSVNVYFGLWGTNTGVVQWRNPRIEEVGLLNVVRRAGAPLTVKIEGGRTLAEGKDFEPITDPRMGNVPWKGEFEVWHEPPVIRTSLPEGTRLRLSYHHAITVYDGQVMICPSEPATIELLRDQARRVHAAWGAKGYFMSHDEIRVLNWDQACADRHLDPGSIVADNVKTCIGILREINPGGDIYVWSDMFDPTHNAVKNYYLVRGDLAGSWRGLVKDVKVMLWNFDKRAETLKWFADLGNPMLIAGYYDGPVDNIRQWLDAARPYPGVTGVMYTTWENNYRDLEKFSEAMAAPD